MRGPGWFWICVVLIGLSIPIPLWVFVELLSFQMFDSVGPFAGLMLLGHVVSRLASLVLLLWRRSWAAYAIAAAFAIDLLDVLSDIHFDTDTALAVAGVGTWLAIALYAFRLQKTGFLRPWREPGPASVFD
jgi:uncharacterized MnhB-related membrane protein